MPAAFSNRRTGHGAFPGDRADCSGDDAEIQAVRNQPIGNTAARPKPPRHMPRRFDVAGPHEIGPHGADQAIGRPGPAHQSGEGPQTLGVDRCTQHLQVRLSLPPAVAVALAGADRHPAVPGDLAQGPGDAAGFGREVVRQQEFRVPRSGFRVGFSGSPNAERGTRNAERFKHLPIHGDCAGNRLLERKIFPRTPPCGEAQLGGEGRIGQNPIQLGGPVRRTLRIGQQSIDAVADDDGIAGGAGRDDRLAEGHGFEHGLGQGVPARGMQRNLEQFIQRADVGVEGQPRHRVPAGNRRQRLRQRRGIQSAQDQPHGLVHQVQRLQHHLLVLGPGHDADRAPVRLPFDPPAPRFDLLLPHHPVNATGEDAVMDHHQFPRRYPASFKRGPYRLADRDHPRGPRAPRTSSRGGWSGARNAG